MQIRQNSENVATADLTIAENPAHAASFPVPRLGDPTEVAALVAFLCGAEAAYITGAAIDINGGDLMV